MAARFLPILIFVTVVLVIVLYTPIRREIVYQLGISGDPTTSCCDINNLSDGNFDESASVAVFNSGEVDYPKTSLAQAIKTHVAGLNQDLQVLGTTNAVGEEKWIEVSLAQQLLRAWEGNKIVKEFSISSGKWSPTPKGTFYIWYKTRSQKMEGGSKKLGTYYNLPNVPNNMFFYKGYAVHGAYWHNNFGNPMSHGCVNAPLGPVAELFNWTGPVVPEGKNVVRADASNPGTKVFVH